MTNDHRTPMNRRARCAAWTASFVVASCGFTDPTKPITLVPDDEFDAEEIEAVRQAADSWNLEFGLDIRVAREAAGGQVIPIARDHEPTCREHLGGQAERSEIWLCEESTWDSFSLFQVVRHEIGHTFGIRHVAGEGSVMSIGNPMRHFSPHDRAALADVVGRPLPEPSCETVRWWGYGDHPLHLLPTAGGADEDRAVAVEVRPESVELRTISLTTSRRSDVRASAPATGLPWRSVFAETSGGGVLVRFATEGGRERAQVFEVRSAGLELIAHDPIELPGPLGATTSVAQLGDDVFMTQWRGPTEDATWELVRLDLTEGSAQRGPRFPGVVPQLFAYEGQLFVESAIWGEDPEGEDWTLATRWDVRVFDPERFDAGPVREQSYRDPRIGMVVPTRRGLLAGTSSGATYNGGFRWLDPETLDLSEPGPPVPPGWVPSEFDVSATEAGLVIAAVFHQRGYVGNIETYVARLTDRRTLESPWRRISPDDNASSSGVELVAQGDRWLASWLDYSPQLAPRARCGEW